MAALPRDTEGSACHASADGASADFPALRRADVAVTPPDRPHAASAAAITPDESGGEEQSAYVRAWRATGTPFSSGLRTYAGNSGGSGRRGGGGTERRLKSAASAAAPRRSGVQRRRGSAPGSVRHQELTPPPLPRCLLPGVPPPYAAIRTHRQGGAIWPRPDSPDTRGEAPPPTLPVVPVALFLFDPRVMASRRSFRVGGGGAPLSSDSPSPPDKPVRPVGLTGFSRRQVRTCEPPSPTSSSPPFCFHGNRQLSCGRSPHVRLSTNPLPPI